MHTTRLAVGFVCAMAIAAVTSPVGVSGAVFLLPVQLNVLQVANPAVTPTNLLYNVVSTPGALWRFRRDAHASGPLTRLLLAGTLPGVVIGAVLRVYVLPGPRVFRVVVGLVLVPLGAWLFTRSSAGPAGCPWSQRRIRALAFAVGVVGGVYGIGGGSILGPLLVGSGLAVGVVAPAALASTFATSVLGALTFAALSRHAGDIAPRLDVGLACGAGGLLGGYLGAAWTRRAPETTLRRGLATVAVVLGLTYLVAAGLA